MKKVTGPPLARPNHRQIRLLFWSTGDECDDRKQLAAKSHAVPEKKHNERSKGIILQTNVRKGIMKRARMIEIECVAALAPR